jgi:uncharacterized protein YjbI with pentapeptide repeats
MAIDPKTGTRIVNGYQIGPGADLRGADLRGASLTSANLKAANLSGANLSRAELSFSNLSGANLEGANLAGAQMYLAELVGARLVSANLDGALLESADLSKAVIMKANLSKANLTRSNLSESYLYGANLSGATLSGAQLYKTDFSAADLTLADLSYTDLTNTIIAYACLAYANLKGVRGQGVEFFNCCLDNVDLSESHFFDSSSNTHRFFILGSLIFINSSLKNANLTSAVLGAALFFGADLYGADFTFSDLEGARFSDDPSLLQAGPISYVRLKEVRFSGVSEHIDPKFLKKYKNKKYKNNLKNVKFIKTNLNSATFVGLTIDANFKKASLLGASFVDCDLTKSTNLDEGQSARFIFEGDTKSPSGFTMSDYIDINGRKVGPGMDLRGADLHDVNLAGAVLDGANLSRANLTGADLSYSRMNKTNLSNADLSDSFAKNTKINKTNLTGAKLKSSIFEDSNLSRSNLSKISAQHIKIINSDLNDNNFEYADLSGSYLSNINLNKNKLDNTSFDSSAIINSEFKNNNYNKVNFKNTTFTGSSFYDLDLADSDFRKARIDRTLFGSAVGAPVDMRRTKFKNAKFYNNKPNTVPYLMSEDLLKIFAEDIAKARAGIDSKIESHPYYLGRRSGLWIHITNHPEVDYFGELCVSPYEKGEHTAGSGRYGVIFEGTAPLFKTDVSSEKANYGFLKPSPPLSSELEAYYKYKEGFLDTQAAKIVQLNVMGGQGSPSIIKKFKDRGIPVKIFKRGVEVPPREPNPKRSCCECGRRASLMDPRGNTFCEECY